MKKMLAAAGIATVAAVAGLTSAGIVSAATTASASANPVSSLADELAGKFNLKKADVQSVLDVHRTEVAAHHEAQIKARVAKLVTDGKITQDQADKINAKRAELQAQRGANKTAERSKTAAQRKADREARRTALEAWAKDNGIATSYLRFVIDNHYG